MEGLVDGEWARCFGLVRGYAYMRYKRCPNDFTVAEFHWAKARFQYIPKHTRRSSWLASAEVCKRVKGIWGKLTMLGTSQERRFLKEGKMCQHCYCCQHQLRRSKPNATFGNFKSLEKSFLWKNILTKKKISMRPNSKKTSRTHKKKLRRVIEGQTDKIIEDHILILQLQSLLEKLLYHIPYIENAPYSPRLRHHDIAIQQMEKIFGYYVERGKSQVGGSGVFIRCKDDLSENVPCVQRGQIVGLYPGLLYLPSQPMLIQSICNKFIFRCIDGIHVDGNDRRLSNMIYKSCLGRDRIGFHPIADESWLTALTMNPLSIGQYVNNQSKEFKSNVAYQELNVNAGVFPLQTRRFIPNWWYSLPVHAPIEDVPLKLVALVATKPILRNQELFSDYFTVVS